jgi:hypothetical protein
MIFNLTGIRTQISQQEFNNALDGVGVTQIIHCSISCRIVLTCPQSIHWSCDSVLWSGNSCEWSGLGHRIHLKGL